MDFDEFLFYNKVSVITCQAKQLCEVLSLSRKIQHFFRKKLTFSQIIRIHVQVFYVSEVS